MLTPSSLVDAAQDAEDFLHHQRRQPERWFVEQQQFRPSISARAIASICCSPPDSVPACCCRRSLQAREIAIDAFEVLQPPRRDRAAYRRRASDFPRRVRCTKVPRPSGTWATPRRTMSSVCRPSIGWPAKTISPAVRTRMLQIARRIVVLPAPLAPSSVVMPPSRDREIETVHHLRLAVGGVDVRAVRATRCHAAVPR